ncbi:CatB-related O-acetyltransferase [Spirosoma panaciterrae]|uniref:CatB-related O-acetyltransferase n=1 Tax=Spirosoma panaciterrae TaxID=496058 RepID=UPI00035E98CF|nr:CatB-related O-acetyltransferase [Spirosoma panaciterrae]
MAKTIRAWFYRFIKYIIPEINILKKNIHWNEFVDYKGFCTIDENVKINSPYNLQSVTIGSYTYIDRNSYISNTEIGKFCSIGPNLVCGWGIHPTNGISTSPMFYSTKKQNGLTLSPRDKIIERKKIVIENDVFIGANVTILDGVTIGNGAIIGAGAVVSKNIPPYAIAIGVPINIIKFRFSEDHIKALLEIQWWNFSIEKLKQIEEFFFDLDQFIEKFDQ